MLSLNTQKTEQVVKSDGQDLDVQGDPWVTLQGEGPYAGHPAVFVRLAGCTLQCPRCDTQYTDRRSLWSLDGLVQNVLDLMPVKWKPIVVITGGEPFRQNIAPLVQSLTCGHNLTVQIETNGRERPQGDGWDVWNPNLKVVVSPKLTVCADIWKLASTAKYVLKAGQTSPDDGLPLGVLGYQGRPDRPPKGWPGRVYVQPQDDGGGTMNEDNAKECVRAARTYGYVVSVQSHKILGLP